MLLFLASPMSWADYPIISICSGSGTKDYPDIDGDIVVWVDDHNGNMDIYGYRLNTDTEFPVYTGEGLQAKPAISGNLVVWEDDRNGSWDIYGKNLTTGSEFFIPVTPGYSAEHADISGDYVV